jgi:hypothetical protein
MLSVQAVTGKAGTHQVSRQSCSPGGGAPGRVPRGRGRKGSRFIPEK